jgi:hypothetical protein
MDATIKGTGTSIFRIVNFSAGSFIVMFKDKSSIYNLRVLL